MISSKRIYTDNFPEFRLDQEKLIQLQKKLLDMFTEVKDVFDKYEIDYMMSGGTLLGTIRHQGFIPWDDDIDLMMTRDEYLKFKNVFDKELGKKYILAEPLSDSLYVSKMPKIFLKNTTYIEIPTAGIDKFHMLFIDLFIVENIPGPGFKRMISSIIYDFSFKGASVCCDYLYPSPPILKKQETNEEIKKYYSKRRRLGCVFSHIGGLKFYLKIVDRIASKFKETGWKAVPSAISYNREVFEAEVYTKLTTGSFCGLNVKIPFYYDKYLKNLYGDYMQIPAEDKREVHAAYKISI